MEDAGIETLSENTLSRLYPCSIAPDLKHATLSRVLALDASGPPHKLAWAFCVRDSGLRRRWATKKPQKWPSCQRPHCWCTMRQNEAAGEAGA